MSTDQPNIDPAHLALELEKAVKNLSLEPGAMMQILPIYRRFWFPHPYATAGKVGGFPLLWRWRVVGYRYVVDGQEVTL